MRYRLVVLTHGTQNQELLERTIVSFSEMVTPAPDQRFVVQDGPCALPPVEPLGEWAGVQLPHEGFCEATRYCWNVGAQEGVDFTFHLEHDFVFRKPVDLRDVAVVLNDTSLAQVAFLRQPLGLREQRQGIVPDAERVYRKRGDKAWWEHKRFFTTNPSLMRVGFMRENPWPRGEQCEGRYSIHLRESGYRSAYWGTGEQWVEHIGAHGTGSGY